MRKTCFLFERFQKEECYHHAENSRRRDYKYVQSESLRVFKDTRESTGLEQSTGPCTIQKQFQKALSRLPRVVLEK